MRIAEVSKAVAGAAWSVLAALPPTLSAFLPPEAEVPWQVHVIYGAVVVPLIGYLGVYYAPRNADPEPPEEDARWEP